MEIDVILLSYTKNDTIFKMTKKCIESIINSEKEYSFNIILIETEKSGKYKYESKKIKTIVPNEAFNYNKFLNIGLKYCKNEWVLISNNDTEYKEGWLTEMMRQNQKDRNLLSMSPLCPIWKRHKNGFKNDREVYYGYRTTYEITGWSLLINKKVIDAIGSFDEQFAFWYQDDDYAKIIQEKGIKHALVMNSIVYHHHMKSHGLFKKDKRIQMTRGSNKIFSKKWEGRSDKP